MIMFTSSNVTYKLSSPSSLSSSFPLLEQEIPPMSPATNCFICSAETLDPCLRTTKAFGISPAALSGTPITPTSATSGWLRISDSSSAGATCSHRKQNEQHCLDYTFIPSLIEDLLFPRGCHAE